MFSYIFQMVQQQQRRTLLGNLEIHRINGQDRAGPATPLGENLSCFTFQYDLRSLSNSRGYVLDFSNFWSLNFGFPVVFGGPRGFTKLREACKKTILQISPNTLWRIPTQL